MKAEPVEEEITSVGSELQKFRKYPKRSFDKCINKMVPFNEEEYFMIREFSADISMARKKSTIKNKDTLPRITENTIIRSIEKEGSSHTGPFRGAIDFIVDLGTEVAAPLDGHIMEVVDNNDKYGPSRDFKDFLNYITISHANGEFSQLAHLAKNSAVIKAGEYVHEGQIIALTGNSGWMYEPHLHMLVFRLDKGKYGFKGLEIQLEGAIEKFFKFLS